MLPFQQNVFHEIQTPKVDYKHARMVEIGQHQIYQLIKLYQLEKRIQQTLTNSNWNII